MALAYRLKRWTIILASLVFAGAACLAGFVWLFLWTSEHRPLPIPKELPADFAAELNTLIATPAPEPARSSSSLAGAAPEPTTRTQQLIPPPPSPETQISLRQDPEFRRHLEMYQFRFIGQAGFFMPGMVMGGMPGMGGTPGMGAMPGMPGMIPAATSLGVDPWRPGYGTLSDQQKTALPELADYFLALIARLEREGYQGQLASTEWDTAELLFIAGQLRAALGRLALEEGRWPEAADHDFEIFRLASLVPGRDFMIWPYSRSQALIIYAMDSLREWLANQAWDAAPLVARRAELAHWDARLFPREELVRALARNYLSERETIVRMMGLPITAPEFGWDVDVNFSKYNLVFEPGRLMITIPRWDRIARRRIELNNLKAALPDALARLDADWRALIDLARQAQTTDDVSKYPARPDAFLMPGGILGSSRRDALEAIRLYCGQREMMTQLRAELDRRAATPAIVH